MLGSRSCSSSASRTQLYRSSRANPQMPALALLRTDIWNPHEHLPWAGDHSAVLTASAPHIVFFLDKRISNVIFSTRCANETKVPSDLENANRPLDDHEAYPFVWLNCFEHLLFVPLWQGIRQVLSSLYMLIWNVLSHKIKFFRHCVSCWSLGERWQRAVSRPRQQDSSCL